jgi:hypothetical protein
MAWLARLDSRSTAWPLPARLAYLSAKWYLISAGAVGAFGLAYQELMQRRASIGLGITTALVLATVKGVISAYVNSHSNE